MNTPNRPAVFTTIKSGQDNLAIFSPLRLPKSFLLTHRLSGGTRESQRLLNRFFRGTFFDSAPLFFGITLKFILILIFDIKIHEKKLFW